jgi:SAM-dependent methyltransferase
MREYYEMEAASGSRQDAMYRGSDQWDRYWHERRVEHLGRVFSGLDGESFLEVGCAEGMLTRLFGSSHPDASRTGFDISEGYLQRARELDPDASYVRGDAADLPFEDRSFDVVLCAETLEHTPDPEKVVSELCRVTARHLVVTVPGRTAPSATVKSLGLLREEPREERLKEPGRGHLHDIGVKDVLSWCEGNGLSLDRLIIDCFVTVRLARLLRLSEKTLRRLDSRLARAPFVKDHGLVQVIIADRES